MNEFLACSGCKVIYIRFETYLWAELLSDLVINAMDDGGQLT